MKIFILFLISLPQIASCQIKNESNLWNLPYDRLLTQTSINICNNQKLEIEDSVKTLNIYRLWNI